MRPLHCPNLPLTHWELGEPFQLMKPGWRQGLQWQLLRGKAGRRSSHLPSPLLGTWQQSGCGCSWGQAKAVRPLVLHAACLFPGTLGWRCGGVANQSRASPCPSPRGSWDALSL